MAARKEVLGMGEGEIVRVYVRGELGRIEWL